VYFSKRNAVIVQPLRPEGTKKRSMKTKFSALFLPKSDIFLYVEKNIIKSERK